MDPWLFCLMLVFGFGGVLVSRHSDAAHLFTLFGGLCLVFAGLGLFADAGLSLPQPITNSTFITNYSYNASTNYTSGHYECINASYYPTNAFMYANGSAYCAAGDTLITTYCDEFPIVQTTGIHIRNHNLHKGMGLLGPGPIITHHSNRNSIHREHERRQQGD